MTFSKMVSQQNPTEQDSGCIMSKKWLKIIEGNFIWIQKILELALFLKSPQQLKIEL